MNTTPLASMTAPAGHVYLVVIPHHWGKGETVNAAFANAAKAAGLGSVVAGTAFDLFLADPEARLNEAGNVIDRPAKGRPAVLVGTYRP